MRIVYIIIELTCIRRPAAGHGQAGQLADDLAVHDLCERLGRAVYFNVEIVIK